MATAVHAQHSAAYAPSKKTAARETRRRERLKMSLPVEVRPFDARFMDIADVGEVVDFTRDGLYFATCMPHYFVGMRLLVTFPFGKKIAAHKKFLGSIVRMEERPDGAMGIAVRFLL
ncbi:MAG: hypothetical protein ABSC10_14640 [Candidatus Acidiferrales bacterium]|jgi:hypothetical protein